MAISFGSMAQITVTTPKTGTKQATTNQAYLYKNTGGDTTRLYLRLGAPGITAAYYEIGGGGGSLTLDTNRLMFLDKSQTATGYKSFTGRAAVSNSGNLTGNALDVFSNSGSLSAIEANNGAGGLAIKAITTNATAFETTNVSAASPSGKFINISSGPHAQFGGTTGKIATVTNSGNIITPKASASNHVVIKSQLDSVAALGGGVTSISAGYGMNFSTITSSGAVVVDSNVIASKSYVAKGFGKPVKDFNADSTRTNQTTASLLYGDTIPGSTINVKDKFLLFAAGQINATVPGVINTIYVNWGGVQMVSFPVVLSSTGVYTFEIRAIVMRDAGTDARVSASLTVNPPSGSATPYVAYSDTGAFNYSSPMVFSISSKFSTSPSGSITTTMGYIEFKPAAL